MNCERIKVLYISGWGRSGSTILSNILGQLEGFFPVGEIRFIWERNLIENRLCGCSVPFQDCTTWEKIFIEAFGGFEKVDAARMMHLCESITRTRQVFRILFRPDKMKVDPDTAEYLAHLEKLYCAIQTISGCQVIVDSSKYPSYAAILDLLPNIDLYVVHLVRDSRAVSFSWGKKKRQPDSIKEEYMIQFSSFQSSLIWNAWNVLTELFWRKTPKRYLLVRYEDFISDPQGELKRIISFVNQNNIELPIEEGGRIRVMVNHTLSGNPVRFQKGYIALKLDDEWRKKSKPLDFFVTTLLTWPLLLKYQYFG